VTENDTYVSDHELLSLLGTRFLYLDTLMRFAVPGAGRKLKRRRRRIRGIAHAGLLIPRRKWKSQ